MKSAPDRSSRTKKWNAQIGQPKLDLQTGRICHVTGFDLEGTSGPPVEVEFNDTTLERRYPYQIVEPAALTAYRALQARRNDLS